MSDIITNCAYRMRNMSLNCDLLHYDWYSTMATWVDMSHQQVISASGAVPLSFAISTPKALRLLLVHKILDNRFQLFVVKWACSFFAVLGVGVCGFSLLPMVLFGVVFAFGISLLALLLWVGVGDIFLRFALEDGCFFELATRSHALDIFEDPETPPHQPGYLVCGSGERRVSRFGGLTKRRFRPSPDRRWHSRPRTGPGLSDTRTRR